MRFDVITLFPELFQPFLETGVTRRAFEGKLVDVRLWPLRDFAEGAYRRVHYRPFCGGPCPVIFAPPPWPCSPPVRSDPVRRRAPWVVFPPSRPCSPPPW